MKTSRLWQAAVVCPVVLLAFMAGRPALAQAVDEKVLERKQEDQQRARAMARELISSILDIQIQQLEENGLQDMEIYRDIRTMRGNLNELVDREMARVVDILVAAQAGSREQREQKFVEARQVIREIVIRLSVERQNLLKRLKAAEIAEQVRRLIQLETAALTTTKSIPTETRTRQEQLALRTIEDQRDIRELFLLLVETLSDVRTWDGPIATGAADGLRILKAAEVGMHLDRAGETLAATNYEQAAVHQAAVIRGLEQLLKIIQHTQGLIGSETQAAIDKIKELETRQEQLREKTGEAALKVPPDTALVEEQSKIQQELGTLAEQLADMPTAGLHLEEAKKAAFEAVADIFDAKQEEAVAEQGKVLGHLAALKELLENMADADASDKSAAELAEMVKDLEAARKDIEAARQQQAKASKTAATKPQAAAPEEAAVAEKVAAAAEERTLPQNVKSRIAEAEEAAKAAAEALKEADDAEAAKPELARAEEALERAAAETEAAIADVQRREAAVRIGELARAAEALERAAAAERMIAEEAAAAVKTEGLDAEQAKSLAQEQDEVQEVAEKIAEGVKESAPQAAEKLAEAVNDAEAAAAGLKQAEQKPGAASKPAAMKTASSAESAAGKLAEAAKELRKEVGETAGELAALAGEQLQKLGEAGAAVEQVMQDRPASIAERMEKLAAAQEKVQDARAAQQRAAGRPEAAEAMQFAGKIAVARRQQAAARRAAADVASGKANTPLAATARQQEVADTAGELAAEAAKRSAANKAAAEGKSDPIAEALQQAQQAAAEAARQTLDGKDSQAETSRDAAAEALRKAEELARAEAGTAAAAAPTGKPDSAMQQQVAAATAEAREMAAADSADAAESLAEAGEAADEAAEELKTGDSAAAKPSQEKAAAALEEAGEQIADAMRRLAQEEAQALARQAEQAAQAAKTTAAVDPGATSALRAAQKEAGAASRQMAGRPASPMNDDAPLGQLMNENGPATAAAPEQAAAAEQAVGRNLERAAANLAAHEQQVRRDLAVARALAKLSKEQQKAAEEIAAQRDALDEMTTHSDQPQPKGEPAPMTAAKEQATRKLGRAMQQFAQAQRATGQGAVELSGQQEVANPPIREGLQLASHLPVGAPPLPPPGPPPTGGEGQPAGDASQPGTAPLPSAGMPPGQGQAAQAGTPSEPSEASRQGEPTGSATGPAQPSSTALGTGFIPNAPEATAEAMAGPQAQAALASAAAPPASPQGQSQHQAQGQTPGQGQSRSEQTVSASPSATVGGSSRSGDLAQNDPLQEGPLETANPETAGDSRTADAGARDADAAALDFGEQPWFAKLPPELRTAIRANAIRPAPRAYEERLRRYFESIE